MSDQLSNLTSKAWILYDYGANKYWRGYNTMDKLQIASLTKMYTLQACLQINADLNIRAQFQWVQVLQSTEIGTQAHLIVGKYITLQHLYYGLMLPSGNDAALNLAYYYGYFLGQKERFPDYYWNKQSTCTLQGKKKYKKIYLARFMNYLNEQLVTNKLKHEQTHFQNPHGLSDKLQKSTAWQLVNATMYFLNNNQFQKISKTQSFTAEYKDGETQAWQNTNILLKDGYIGVKTGYTTTAGSCLCSRKIIYENKKKHDLLLVLLGSKTQQDRFTETIAIIENFRKYLQLMR